MKSRKNSFNNTKKLSIILYIPLLLIAGLVPLLVYGKYINLEGTLQFQYWTGVTELLEFFSYWKSRWFVALTVLSLFTYLILFLSKRTTLKKEYKYYIPLGVYALCVIISTIFSIDLSTALNGFIDMYQGTWVLLSYVAITFLMINLVNDEREVKWFLNAFIVIVFIEGLIGLGQYFGLDIFNTKFGNSLILPRNMPLSDLSFTFGKHTIYGTLFNTNYVGSFVALMLPISVVYLIIAKTNKTKIIGVISLVLCIFTWIGCNSRAGYLGIVFSCIVSIVILRKYILKYWKIVTAFTIVAVICFFGMNIATHGQIIKRVKAMNIFSSIENNKKLYDSESTFKIYDINIENNIIDIKTSHLNLKVKAEDGQLYFMDEDNNILPVKQLENGNLVADVDNGKYIQIYVNEGAPVISLKTPWLEKGQINFYVTKNQVTALSNCGQLVSIENAESAELFNGLDSLMSGRGYIWSRTLPLLKKYIIIGAGPDNYTFAFPQNDYISKMNIDRKAYEIVDKPHNMYLQIAVNTGCVSLLSFLAVCLIYITTSLKIMWKSDFSKDINKIGLACFASIIGYLFAGLFNDQIISVAPIFFILLGIGISINIKIKDKDKSNVKTM